MEKQDYQKFKEVMAGLAEMYDKTPSSVMLGVFWDDFKEVSIADFAKAVSSHRKDPDQGMFFPKTANLFKQLNGTSKDQKRSIESRAELAWSGILRHLQYHGAYKTFTCDDGVALASFKAIGGMGKLSTASNDDIVWIKKEFISMYETYENTPLENLPSNVMGLEDLQRSKLQGQQGMRNVLEQATKMIEEQDQQTKKQSWETGKANIEALKAIAGGQEKPEVKGIELKPKGKDRYEGMSQEDRKNKMLNDAKNKLKKV